jgi:hypothetical protein
MMKKIALALLALLISTAAAFAQSVLPLVPLGYCQMTSVSASAGITAANCIRASFTATGTGNSLAATSVTGQILPGDAVTGTGVPAGTYIASQVPGGTVGGAGTYITSNPTTSSGASLTSGGIPQSATQVMIEAEAQIVRYRDDGAAPTAAVGMPIAVAQTVVYTGTLSKLRFIQATGGAIINLLFYR